VLRESSGVTHRLLQKVDLFPSSEQNWDVTQLHYLYSFFSSFNSSFLINTESLRMETGQASEMLCSFRRNS